jgi:hypothetical protein
MNSEKYIGLDVHQATISVAVMDSQGKIIMESVLETEASTLLEFIAGLRGSLFVTFEEGTWAAWLYDLLKPHVTEVLSAIRARSHWSNRATKVTRSMLANLLIACASMISSRSTTARPAYAGCASWPAVTSLWSKIFPGS